MSAEPDESRRGFPTSLDDATSGGASDRRRHDWLARRLQRDVRAPLQVILLRLQNLGDGLEGGELDADHCRERVATVVREVRQMLALTDDLVALGRPDADAGDPLWLRSIVARDLLAAAVRLVASEPEAGAVEIEYRAVPHDLRLVADPDRTLRALSGLLRAGLRSSRARERLELEASASRDPEETGTGEGEGGGDAGGGWVRLVLRAPRLTLGPDAEVQALCRGLPSGAVDPRRAVAALPLAVAGRHARLMDGRLEVEREDAGDGKEGATAVLRLPRDREPERRAGWIP